MFIGAIIVTLFRNAASTDVLYPLAVCDSTMRTFSSDVTARRAVRQLSTTCPVSQVEMSSDLGQGRKHWSLLVQAGLVSPDVE